ncbi:MAG: hypothetical protein ACKOYM_10535 [Actinomycetes bacterium]
MTLHDHLRTSREATDAGIIVRKRGRGLQADHLAREAEVLRILDGHATVRLVEVNEADDWVELVLADEGTDTLSDVTSMSATRARRAVTKTCLAVATLHAAGWGHGALAPDHVVVNRRGNVRLCSLSSSKQFVADPTARERDVEQLAAMLVTIAAELHNTKSRPHRAAGRTIRRVVAKSPPDPTVLAQRLSAAAHRRKPRHVLTRGRTVHGRPVRTLVALTAVAAATPVVLGLRAAPPTGVDAADRPQTERTRSSANEHGNDASIVLAAACGRPAAIVVLRSPTGDVFAAPMPDEQGVRRDHVRALFITRIPHARRISSAQDPRGCSEARIETASGGAVRLNIFPPTATHPQRTAADGDPP